jgi:hypothetical protein
MTKIRALEIRVIPFSLVTSVAYDPSKLTGMKLFVLNSNTIYCSIIPSNRTEVQHLYNSFIN